VRAQFIFSIRLFYTSMEKLLLIHQLGTIRIAEDIHKEMAMSKTGLEQKVVLYQS